jgi:hypothetical protein
VYVTGLCSSCELVISGLESGVSVELFYGVVWGAYTHLFAYCADSTCRAKQFPTSLLFSPSLKVPSQNRTQTAYSLSSQLDQNLGFIMIIRRRLFVGKGPVVLEARRGFAIERSTTL